MNSAAQPTDPIFEAICSGRLPEMLDRRTEGITAATIAAWHEDPVHIRQLENFNAVCEWQARIMEARIRTRMVLALAGVTADPNSSPETIRKACCEYFKLSRTPRVRRVRIPKSAQPAREESPADQSAARQVDHVRPSDARPQKVEAPLPKQQPQQQQRPQSQNPLPAPNGKVGGNVVQVKPSNSPKITLSSVPELGALENALRKTQWISERKAAAFPEGEFPQPMSTLIASRVGQGLGTRD